VQGGEDCDNACAGGEPNASSELLGCTPEYTLYIPLQFWFCRNPGLALPLIALQYHEVRINLQFNDLQNLMWDYAPVNANVHVIRDRVNSSNLVAASLYVDYIYLDTDERRKFAQVSHEYLIDVLQYTGAESINSSSNKLKLNFNHPCKELVWVVQRDSFVSCDDNVVNPWKGQQPFNYSDWWDRSALESGYSVTRVEGMAGKNPVVTALIQLNGHDRFTVREGDYFNLVQPFQHHTNVPAVGINVYSFALSPEQHQPSGTCNLSRIDNTTLLLTVSNNAVGTATSSQVRVYATNYNVLRVMSGMGGLAYSN
jgi:Large eukaryotic DNA virus major capsid protein/Major capsid protein N-terminus